MATADQIRASATAALGAMSSSQMVTSGAVQAAPSANKPPEASDSDVVVPAPAANDMQKQIEALQAQLAQALGVIATLRPAAPAVTGARTYHSGAPFIKIQVMKGVGICEEFQFKGHKLTTDDPAAIAFMEATIASGHSNFSHSPVSTVPTPEEMDMKRDVVGAAVTARDKMLKAGEAVV